MAHLATSGDEQSGRSEELLSFSLPPAAPFVTSPFSKAALEVETFDEDIFKLMKSVRADGLTSLLRCWLSAFYKIYKNFILLIIRLQSKQYSKQ